jgi:hypothetical protein
MDFDFIAYSELQRFYHNGGKANRETVSPFGDPHTGSS